MTTGFSPIILDAPPVNPAPGGLYPVTSWSDSAEGDPLRWLPAGVQIRTNNYGLAGQFGVWGADWCASEEDLDPEDDVKAGERPDNFLDPFEPMTVFAYDRNQCGDMSAEAQLEVRLRASQAMRLQESLAVEAEFATRLLADATTPTSVADIVEAVSVLEEKFAATNTIGLIHARQGWQAYAAQAMLLTYRGSAWTTPAGHKWVFGNGYATPLGDVLIGTSPTMGWRGPVQLRDAVRPETGRYIAIAERSVVVGFEALVGAVEIS